MTTCLVSIIPLAKMPSSTPGKFTYRSKEPTSTGDLVLIPFRNREILGVIAGTDQQKEEKENRKYTVKDVIRVVEPEFLTPHQIQLIEKVSEHYFASAALVAKMLIPERVSQQKAKSYVRTAQARRTFTIKHREIDTALEINGALEKKRSVLYVAQDRRSIYLYLITKILKERRQILFLVPDKFLLSAYGMFFENIFGAVNIAILDKDLSLGSYYASWKKIKNGDPLIVLGTRSAVFAPLKNGGLIIIDEAHDTSFKQWDQNPRYDARYVSDLVSETMPCPMLIGSNCPTTSLYYSHRKRRAVVFGKEADAPQKQEARLIVDAGETGNFSRSKCVSEPVIDLIGDTLTAGKTVFVAASQKGSAGCHICGDCGHIAKCPDCDKNYYPVAGGMLVCPVCGKKVTAPPKCPECSNPSVRPVGLGAERLSTELRQLFPKNSTLLLEERKNKAGAGKERVSLSVAGSIVVGTLNLLRVAKFNPHLGALVLINPDKSLFVPDFTSRERRYQEIAGIVLDRVPLIIQTRFPDSPLLTMAVKEQFKRFYSREISARKTSGLPPFGDIILFTAREKDEDEAAKNISRLRILISDLIEKTCSASDHVKPDLFSLSSAYQGFPERVRQKYVYHITLSFLESRAVNALDMSSIIIHCVKNGIIIDVDPVGLI